MRLKGGTANSDSHTLAEGVLGYPRTLVAAGQTLADFDAERFDEAVRAGRMFGTSGPVLLALRRASCPGPGRHLDVVAPGAVPRAFTNPLLFDLDGLGWSPPGLP